LDLSGKRLLVLGGTNLSCEIIRRAQKMGVYVIVTDYLPDSPGKKIANKSYLVSTTDVVSVVELIKKERVDGVLTGFIEMMLPYYQLICKKANLHCYATENQINIATNKNRFKSLCREFDIPVVNDYKIDYPFSNKDLDHIQFPAIIKPYDSGGGRGIYICWDPDELRQNYSKALNFSSQNAALIEDHVNANEVSIFYLIQDGRISLSTMADRFVQNFFPKTIPLPIAYLFPSKHLKKYQQTMNIKVTKMFESIGIKNGMLFIQSFVKDGNFIFYEMGFRLTSSLEYKIIAKFNHINPLETMINFALTGSMWEKQICSVIDPNYDEYGFNLTFIAKPGQVGEILGVQEV